MTVENCMTVNQVTFPLALEPPADEAARESVAHMSTILRDSYGCPEYLRTGVRSVGSSLDSNFQYLRIFPITTLGDARFDAEQYAHMLAREVATQVIPKAFGRVLTCDYGELVEYLGKFLEASYYARFRPMSLEGEFPARVNSLSDNPDPEFREYVCRFSDEGGTPYHVAIERAVGEHGVAFEDVVAYTARAFLIDRELIHA